MLTKVKSAAAADNGIMASDAAATHAAILRIFIVLLLLLFWRERNKNARDVGGFYSTKRRDGKTGLSPIFGVKSGFAAEVAELADAPDSKSVLVTA